MGRDTLELTKLANGGFIDMGQQPRVHPNGFIQLDLNEAQRLHVWHPLNPYRQKTYSPIHNHIFDFVSQVHTGRLINVMYSFEPDLLGTHEEWVVKVIEGQDTKLVKEEGGRFNLVPMEVNVVHNGGTYHMDKYKYHESLANEPTLTVMTKSNAILTTGPNCSGASVICRVGEPPDNDFRRGDVDHNLLWDLITETMRRI